MCCVTRSEIRLFDCCAIVASYSRIANSVHSSNRIIATFCVCVHSTRTNESCMPHRRDYRMSNVVVIATNRSTTSPATSQQRQQDNNNQVSRESDRVTEWQREKERESEKWWRKQKGFLFRFFYRSNWDREWNTEHSIYIMKILWLEYVCFWSRTKFFIHYTLCVYKDNIATTRVRVSYRYVHA